MEVVKCRGELPQVVEACNTRCQLARPLDGWESEADD
jgi:hypothetical protein